LQRKTTGGFVFETERRGPFTPDAVNRPTKRIAKRAGFTFPIHRQTYALANEGHDTRHSATSFRDFWR
jgi:hypothetical protein